MLSVFDLLASPLPESQNLHLICLGGQSCLDVMIAEPEINRPGLALGGFFEGFGENRVQIFGRGEVSYLKNLLEKNDLSGLRGFFEHKMACCVFTHSLQPAKEFLDLAAHAKVPVLQTNLTSNEFVTRILRLFGNAFAPKETLHGVLVEVHGIGMLLLGDSGVGKSEAALELLDRGHRLVSDDLVELRLVHGKTVIGSLVNKINKQHYLEIRGMGIISVEHLFGTRSCLQHKTVDLVIRLELDDASKNYERTSYQKHRYSLLGISLPLMVIPVKPGRNIPVILETAALHFRGLDQQETLYSSVLKRITIE
ncbi:MAG: HPr(Ser) kinase/phosphatase [Spirochaetia bacterium]